jgi:mannitol-1-phosphate 5-dehydrogenase
MGKGKKILLFGAGKIGRSFIGQLFGTAGYQVVFVEVDENLVRGLNERGSYPVIILDSTHPERETTTLIENIRAIHFGEEDKILKEIVEADILATSVGKNGLGMLAGILARGINLRYEKHPERPADIIIAENIRNADRFLGGELDRNGLDLPRETYLGLIETSIGKMVPIMTRERMAEDPLAVYAEPYNTLILDEKAFKNPVPDVEGLSPKKNMKAWVDRKIFIHNMGHATLAYHANYLNPNLIYTWEALENPTLREKTRDTMLQSAGILRELYPAEFTPMQLAGHVEDLLERFANRALGDTIFRVGCDVQRKLARDDRLMVPILAGLKTGAEFDLILEAWVRGCCFRATDENGRELKGDIEFRKKYGRDFRRILLEHCRLTSDEMESIGPALKPLINPG